MNSPAHRRSGSLAFCGLLALAAPSLGLAYKKGDTAYAKRLETHLLAEPNALAAAAGKVPFAEALAITETRGAWLQVKTKTASGWVFEGNVAAEKPSLAPAAGLTTVDASATNTAAAARPLSEAATAYAGRHGATNARDDLDWLQTQAAKTTPTEVDSYLKTNKKGEYRP